MSIDISRNTAVGPGRDKRGASLARKAAERERRTKASSASHTFRASAPRNFLIMLVVVTAFTISWSILEWIAYGWHPAREELPDFSQYHLIRMAASAGAGLLLIGVLVRAGGTVGWNTNREVLDCMAMGSLGLAPALGLMAVFFIDPQLFHVLAGEDHFVEWMSALSLFVGSGLFLISAKPLLRNRQIFDLLLAVGFAGLYFVIAMEEISWMQRVFGYATPDAVAQVNWQSEFNLHNIHTDLFELTYYLGTGVFLLLLPLVKLAVPTFPPLTRFESFIPGFAVSALAAPMLIFTYGQWNLLSIQLLSFAGFATLLAIGFLARGGREKAVFYGLACTILIGAAALLIFGARMIYFVDATEFREFFISLGLAGFAIEYWRRSMRSDLRRHVPAS